MARYSMSGYDVSLVSFPKLVKKNLTAAQDYSNFVRGSSGTRTAAGTPEMIGSISDPLPPSAACTSCYPSP